MNNKKGVYRPLLSFPKMTWPPPAGHIFPFTNQVPPAHHPNPGHNQFALSFQYLNSIPYRLRVILELCKQFAAITRRCLVRQPM